MTRVAPYSLHTNRYVVLWSCVMVATALALASGDSPLREALSSKAVEAVQPTCTQVIEDHYPRQYVAYKAQHNHTPVFDGLLDEPFWTDVPFTTTFVDISTATLPRFTTRAKIRWDDDWVYVGAVIQDTAVWANITYTCHCYNTSENQVIFDDNDFEVFFDVDGTCHWYKEYEMNAANQNWDLLLNAPYENQGYENSTRVFGKSGFDMVPPLYCATFVDGVLNDPASRPAYWSVEIAFPMDKLLYRTTLQGSRPGNKQFFRINFSRVEWAVRIVNNTYQKYPSCQSCPTPGTPTCDNWVWSPMYAIDMHHPELWGFLQLSTDPVNTTDLIYNVEWPARYVAHELYYGMVNYYSAFGTYATSVQQLLPYTNHNVTLNEECTGPITIWTNANASHPNATAYVALIPSATTNNNNTTPLAITITQDRYILAHYFNTSTTTLHDLRSGLSRFARQT